MKILHLELEGFGPFHRRQRIDFTTFAEDGLFLIGGKTGAGKSSLLDAVTFALYARTPRYDNETPRGVRSNFAGLDDPTLVTLQFEHGDRQFRISRSPEYEVAKKRGGGTTTSKPAQEFSEWIDGSWRVIATSTREVEEKLREIFPLSADEFLQVVMLAQNKFQQFLHVDSKDRQAVLRKLFRTGRYKTVSEFLAERAKVSGDQLNQLTAKLTDHARTLEEKRASQLTDESHNSATTESTESTEVTAVDAITAAWLDTFVESAEAQHVYCNQMRTIQAKARDTAAESLRQARDVRARQDRREKARKDRQALVADRERLTREVSARLEADTAASPLISVVVASQQTAKKLSRAQSSLEQARTNLQREADLEEMAKRPSLFEDQVPSIERVKEVARSLTETIGALRDNRDIDTTIAAKEKAINDVTARVKQHKEKRNEIEARAALRPGKRTQLSDALSTAKAHAEGDQSAQESLKFANEQLSATKKLPKAEQSLREAASKLSTALRASGDAERHERDLNDQRWLGAATHLAELLQDGEACAVCGSHEHPAPASSDVAPVTDEQVAAATEATIAAQKKADIARQGREQALTEVETIRTLAGGLDLEAATAKVATAEDALQKITQAQAEIGTLTEAINVLDRESESDTTRSRELVTAEEASRTELITLEAQLADLQQLANSLRGAYASVGERLTRTRAIESVCEAVVSAAESVGRAQTEDVAALEQLTATLADSDFNTADEILEARLSDSVRKQLTFERDTHAKNLHAAEQTLAEPELAELPEEPVELEQLTLADAEAQTSLDQANRKLGIAETLLTDIRSTVTAAKRTLDDLERVRDRATAERELASTLNGQNERKQNLEAFVLAAYLEEVLAAANARLGDITANRYELELDDNLASRGRQSGLGLKIFDIYNGKSRQPRSLSGGETFLVSLALALGLADVVSAQAGGIALDTLFIDEGFGSLDSDTLEVAMRTLDQLREGGRTIGVISHVGSMQERIPARLDVHVSSDGSSDISMAD